MSPEVIRQVELFATAGVRAHLRLPFPVNKVDVILNAGRGEKHTDEDVTGEGRVRALPEASVTKLAEQPGGLGKGLGCP